jgi:hypothetical protein
MTDPKEAPLPAITLPGDDVPWVFVIHRGSPCDVSEYMRATMAHLEQLLQTLPDETRREVFRRAFPMKWLTDAADDDAERTLAMTDEEMDAEIRADGEDPARVNKWAKATGRWITMCADLSGKVREAESALETERKAKEELVAEAEERANDLARALHESAMARVKLRGEWVDALRERDALAAKLEQAERERDELRIALNRADEELEQYR